MQEPFQDFIFIGHFYLFSVWPFGSSSTAENECTHPTRARHTGLRTAKRLRVSYHPLLRLLVPSIPFLENTGVHREKKEINREKERERESSINRRRTYTSKAVRLHRSLANIRVPFHSVSKEGREDEEKRSNRDRKKEREENEGKGKNEKRRGKTGKKRTLVEDLIDRLAASSISLKSATRQRNCDGGHEQGQ